MIVNTHSFNIELAEKFGVNEAIIITSIGYWCDHNKKNKKNFNDGRYWTYNTVDAWSDMFPYYSNGQVRRLLDKLVKNGHVIKGNFNEKKYDRTAWYSLSDAICRICQMDLSESSNGFVGIDNTIPVLNNSSNTVEKVLSKDNTKKNEPTRDEKKKAFEFFWSHYPKKTKKGFAKDVWLKMKPEDMQKAIDVIQEPNVQQWFREQRKSPEIDYRPSGLNWLKGEMWDDEYEVSTPLFETKDGDPF